MALSIKTEEADRLARQLAAMTGETMTQAVTIALKERVERLRAAPNEGLAQRIEEAAAHLRQKYDLTRPVTKEEWDEAWGDTPEQLGIRPE